jgi:UPF0271 protein
MQTIDLNCDMGEGMGNDGDIMPFVSSANIACGYHAGDSDTMHKTVELALKHDMAIGAHPSFADKENFGRLEQTLQPQQVYDLVAEQIYILQKIANSFGAKLHHVKPHGALYNMAAKDKTMADAIAKAILDIDATLVLYGLYNSFLISAAQQVGLKTANEVFADRRYNANGSLVSRNITGAVIEDADKAVEQVLNMVLHKTVTTIDGEIIPVQAQTVCLHGDGKHAAAFAKLVNSALVDNGVSIKIP